MNKTSLSFSEVIKDTEDTIALYKKAIKNEAKDYPHLVEAFTAAADEFQASLDHYKKAVELSEELEIALIATLMVNKIFGK